MARIKRVSRQQFQKNYYDFAINLSIIPNRCIQTTQSVCELFKQVHLFLSCHQVHVVSFNHYLWNYFCVSPIFHAFLYRSSPHCITVWIFVQVDFVIDNSFKLFINLPLHLLNVVFSFHFRRKRGRTCFLSFSILALMIFNWLNFLWLFLCLGCLFPDIDFIEFGNIIFDERLSEFLRKWSFGEEKWDISDRINVIFPFFVI